MDELELLKEGESFEYVGMTLTRMREEYEIEQKAYFDSIEIDEKKLLRGRLNASLLEAPEEGEVLEDLIPLMQKCTGVTGFHSFDRAEEQHLRLRHGVTTISLGLLSVFETARQHQPRPRRMDLGGDRRQKRGQRSEKESLRADQGSEQTGALAGPGGRPSMEAGARMGTGAAEGQGLGPVPRHAMARAKPGASGIRGRN
uniref:Uncharacterized protein n=1 Tax=Chromera velia CCMP2878 TaxID=1169474 RepID=A0A0G4HSX1_9ALVE|eukprot:Cvel_8322.t1-p1 / transcript=Cvel_8322.t1 / gene=Cvel_8322 / organism=Chromera_velia_CCMP2878 / gene_product=hypothetical protein / transcript_product=hypothetical protein / location=Cvel_scaffold457:60305-68709(-) / protein_length=199 / sequence_SO=supercontig / SO=protein_coding / is_pseudo=false